MYKTRRALLVVVALLAASCSGSDDPVAATSTSVGADSTTTTGASTTSTTATTSSSPEEVTTSTSELAAASDVPSSFWAVDKVTSDLVEVGLDGKIIATIIGYGADAAADPNSPQSLATTDFTGSKVVVSNCCEPVSGHVFIVDPDFTDAVPGTMVPLTGSRPAVSPSGERIAVQMLDFGVAFYTIEGGSLEIDTGALQNKLAMPAANDTVSTYPLAWFDETTLAIVAAGESEAAISIVSIADLSNPVVLSTISIDGFVLASAANSAGELIVSVVTAFDGPVLGLRYDIQSGSSSAIDLPGDAQSIDYDSTGTHLLITQFGASVSYLGPDGLQPIPGQYYGASW